MKRIYPIVLAGLMLLLAGCHKNLWNDINDLKSRVQALEEKCNTMNTNITALQVLINAQSSGDMISNVSEVTYGNATIGYTITFTSGKTITLYNGKDGANGQDGANGTDGINGADGEKGEKGDQGEKGDAGDNIFSSVTQDDNYVYFTLADGTIIKIAKNSSGSDSSHADNDIIEFKDLNVKSALLLHTPVIDTNGDGEISYGEARAATRISINSNTSIVSFKELQYFTGLTSVCFNGYSNLFEVTLPEGLDSIANDAFYRNEKLSNINIPNSVKYIGANAFGECTSLRIFTFPENYNSEPLSTFTTAGTAVCETIKWNTISYPNNYQYTNSSNTYHGIGGVPLGSSNDKIKHIIFGDNVQIIPSYLCYRLDSINEIIIPASVKTI